MSTPKYGRFLLPHVAAALLVGSALGCATTNDPDLMGGETDYSASVNSWLGVDVNTLMSAWGPPSDEYVMPNGNTMYTWLDVGDTHVLSTNFEAFKSTSTRSRTAWCETTFTVDSSGTVVDCRWEGTSCR
jgi:hypothetical protein